MDARPGQGMGLVPSYLCEEVGGEVGVVGSEKVPPLVRTDN